MTNTTFVVKKIKRESDRTLLYDAPSKNPRVSEYYAIDKAASSVNVGDIIEVKDCGVNFGWFVKIVTSKKSD